MTPPVTQAEALASTPLAAGDGARFFTRARFPGLECLTATCRTHVYSAHTHETYVVGIIGAGCETSTARGARHYAGPGDVLFIALIVSLGAGRRTGGVVAASAVTSALV